MRRLVMAAVICCAAAPASAANYIAGQVRILQQDQFDFETVNLNGFGSISSSAVVAPSFGTVTASAANGGSLSASFTGHSFGYVSGFLWYDISIVGPDGPAVPVLIDTHAAVTGTGDMAAFASLSIGSLYQDPGAFRETPDYPLVKNAGLCLGSESPCNPDPGAANWSLNGATIMLVPNRIYPVRLSVYLTQTGYNTGGIFGDGTGTAFVDPVFSLAPGVTGYTLLNSLTVPEPASWALLILGFGLTGAMLRRRGALSAAL